MPARTRNKTVTFKRPVVLDGHSELLPAGIYRVETDEELLEGISFPAYRRTLSVIHLHATADNPGQRRVLAIDPNELDAAIARDKAPRVMPAGKSSAPATPESAGETPPQ